MRKTVARLALVLVLFSTFLGLANGQGNHVLNGSFEDNSVAPDYGFYIYTGSELTNWTKALGTIDIHDNKHHGYQVGADLEQHIDLNEDGVIEQQVNNLIPGLMYTVKFITRLHSVVANNATANVRVVSGSIIYLDQNWSLNIGNIEDIKWTERSFNFIPSSSSVTLRFAGVSGDFRGGVMLDDVRVNETICQVSIDIDSIDCSTFSFSTMSPNVVTHAEAWYINGVKNNSLPGQITLTPGIHEICVSFVGIDSNESSLFCCNRTCRLISVGIDTTFDTADYCDPFSNGYLYNPCQTGNFYYYSISSGGDSPEELIPCSQANSYILPFGTHQIKHYDANGCLRKVDFLTINPVDNESSATHCELTFTRCGDNFDPDNTEHISLCVECYQGYDENDFVYENATLDSVSSGNDTFYYTKRIVNIHTCHMCIFHFTVINSVCNFQLDMYAQPFGVNNSEYDFSISGVPSNACGDITWTITDSVTGAIIYTLVEPAATSNSWMYFNFNGVPGVYYVTFNVCNCECGEQCCKQITTKIRFGEGSGGGEFIQYMKPDTEQPSNPINIIDKGDKLEQEPEKEPNVTKSVLHLELVPNPTSAKFRIASSNKELSSFDKVQIMDAKSSQLLILMNVSTSYEFDLSDQLPGTYFVRIQVGSEMQTLKLSILE